MRSVDRVQRVNQWIAILLPAAKANFALASGIQGLGTIPWYEGTATPQVQAVSADGSTVSGRLFSNDVDVEGPFRWTSASGVQPLGLILGQPSSYAPGISGNGSVIAGYTAGVGGEPNHAYRWTSGAGAADLGTLPGDYGAIAIGLSDDGTVVTGASHNLSDGARAYRWTQSGGMKPLGTLGGSQSYPWGLSGDGSTIVGQSGTTTTNHAFRWTDKQGMQDLGSLPGSIGSNAWATNFDGSVVAGTSHFSPGFEVGFLWTEIGGLQELKSLPATLNTYVGPVNADGSLIFGACEGNGFLRAVLWNSSQTPIDLNVYLPTIGIDLTGWSLETVSGVSADGSVFAGLGTHNGQFESWVVTIPTPGTLSGLALVAVVASRRRR